MRLSNDWHFSFLYIRIKEFFIPGLSPLLVYPFFLIFRILHIDKINVTQNAIRHSGKHVGDIVFMWSLWSRTSPQGHRTRELYRLVVECFATRKLTRDLFINRKANKLIYNKKYFLFWPEYLWLTIPGTSRPTPNLCRCWSRSTNRGPHTIWVFANKKSAYCWLKCVLSFYVDKYTFIITLEARLELEFSPFLMEWSQLHGSQPPHLCSLALNLSS